LLAGLCYFSGFAGLLLFKSLNALKYGLIAGMVVVFGLVVWGGLLALTQMLVALPASWVESITAVAIIAPIIIYWWFKQENKSPTTPLPIVSQNIGRSDYVVSRETLVRALEVVQYPTDYLNSLDDSKRSPLQIACHLVETLTRSDVPLGIRLERISGRFRLLFLTCASRPPEADANLQTIERVAGSLLPGFAFKKYSKPFHINTETELVSCVSHMTGEPAPPDEPSRIVDGLTTLAEMLKRTTTDVVVQIWVTPDKPGFFEKRSAQHEFESRTEAAPQSISVTKPGSLGAPPKQESYAALDPVEIMKRDRAARKLARVSNEWICRVQVSAACRARDKNSGERLTKQLLNTLAGSVKSSDPQRIFEIKTGRNFVHVYQLGEPSGPSTLLLPHEAAVYFVLPRCDLGLAVTNRGVFHTNPVDLSAKPQASVEVYVENSANPTLEQEMDSILLGEAVDEGGRSVGDFRIRLDSLAEHVGIYGGTGSGKTNTAMVIAYEAYRRHVTPLVMLPGKVADWRALQDVMLDLRVFTAGDETTAPFRFNPFRCPDGVLLNTFIGAVIDCFVAAWPTEGIIKEHVENVFNTAFAKAGWDRRANKRGKTILVPGILKALFDVERTALQYSDRMNQDFVGALRARFSTLLRDPLMPIFNTRSGLTVKELLSKPTIIEMRGLSPEQKALLTSLLTVHIALYLEAQTTASETGVKGLKHILILEEAHHFLKRTPSERSISEGHSAQEHAIGSIVGVLRESRASGLGVFPIDQLPGSMAEEAVKLPGTTIIHYLNDPVDRTLVGLQANCSEDQIRHIGGMARGEAVVHLTRTSQPVKVKVRHLGEVVPGGLSDKVWTDKAVAERMQRVYTEHPELLDWEEVPADLVKEVFGIGSQGLPGLPTGTETVKLDVNLVTELLYMIDEPAFGKAYDTAMRLAMKGDPLLATLSIRNIVREVVEDSSKVSRYCEYLVWYLSHKKETADWLAAHDDILECLKTELELREEA